MGTGYGGAAKAEECQATAIDPRVHSLEVHPDGRWARVDGNTVSFAHRPRLWPVLALLWRAHLATPTRFVTVAELVEAAWPGEPLDEKHRRNRVRFAIWALRSYGLGRFIQTTRAGYRLHPDLARESRSSEIREIAPQSWIGLSIDD